MATPPKALALAAKLRKECVVANSNVNCTASRAADELVRMHAMLTKARQGLSNGLWDYGPGQCEHEQCNVLLAEIDVVLAVPKKKAKTAKAS